MLDDGNGFPEEGASGREPSGPQGGDCEPIIMEVFQTLTAGMAAS